jgi:universal stress protein A
MLEIRTVLCPVDFSQLSERAVELATAISRSFGARLVLHHNLDAVSPGLSMGWMWNQVHAAEQTTEANAEAALRALLADIPAGVEVEGRISDGQVASSLLYLEEQTGADLLVLATHGATSEEHASVAERILAGIRCPALVLHEGEGGAPAWPAEGEPELPVLVPVHWTKGGEAALAYALELARALPVRLRLLHVIEKREGRGASGEQLEAERRKIESAVPEDLRGRVATEVVAGAAEPEILAAAERLGARWMVMGTQSPGLLHRLFSRDTAHGLLHRAPCPVWYVPAK